LASRIVKKAVDQGLSALEQLVKPPSVIWHT